MHAPPPPSSPHPYKEKKYSDDVVLKHANTDGFNNHCFFFCRKIVSVVSWQRETTCRNQSVLAGSHY